MKIRWYVTSQPFLPITQPSVINSRDWDDEDWRDLVVGEGAQPETPRIYNAMWGPPVGLPGNTLCHSEWFGTGEPWPVTLPNTVYDDSWIPECCGGNVACATEECRQEQVNGMAGSQHFQYAIPATQATDDTPAWMSQVAQNQGGGSPAKPGMVQQYLPLGRNGAPLWQHETIRDAAGALISDIFAVQMPGGGSVSQSATPTQWQMGVDDGTNSGNLTLSIQGGVAQLSGTNAQIDPAIGAAFQLRRTEGTKTATGTDQSGAALITTDAARVVSTVDNRGVILPATEGAVICLFNQSTASHPIKVYPPVGEYLWPEGGSANQPVTLEWHEGLICMRYFGGQWFTVKAPAPP